jgi:hypothetical protein
VTSPSVFPEPIIHLSLQASYFKRLTLCLLCLGALHFIGSFAQEPQNVPQGVVLPARESRHDIFPGQEVKINVADNVGYYFPQFWDSSTPPGHWADLLDLPITAPRFTDLDCVGNRLYRTLSLGGPMPRLYIQKKAGVLEAGGISLSVFSYPGWNYILQSKQVNLPESNWENLNTPSTNVLFILPQAEPDTNYRILGKPPVDREAYTAVLIAGQSNALLNDDIYYPRRVAGVLTLRNSFEFLKPSVFYGQSKGTFVYSFSVGAASELSDLTTNRYLLIETAIGATTLKQWLPGTNRFDRHTLYGDSNYRRVIGAPRGIKAIWYYGHESSASGSGLQTYIQDWKQLIGEFRKDNGPVPVIFAQLAKNTNAIGQAAQFQGAEKQRQTEAGQLLGVADTHMVVTFDLPLGDLAHLSGEAQRLLGHRFALATLEHVYHEPINGTGPRLLRLGHPRGNRRIIQIQFDRAIHEPTNNYDHQFTISSKGILLPIKTITRTSDAVVSIALAFEPPDDVTVSYGSPPPASTDLYLTNVIRDLDGLPAPAFELVITSH